MFDWFDGRLKPFSFFFLKLCSWPSRQEQLSIAEGFKQISDLEGVIGAVDVTFIRLKKKPTDRGESFYCRRGFYAVSLQGICDASGQLLDVWCGWPGRAHDSRVFQTSPIFKFIQMNQATAVIPHGFLVADSAYTSSEWLVKKFDSVDESQPSLLEFNRAIAQARIVIENCWSRLKMRWRWLTSLDCDIVRVPLIVEAACVLHNIAEQLNHNVEKKVLPELDQINADEQDDEHDDRVERISQAEQFRRAQRFRQRVLTAFQTRAHG